MIAGAKELIQKLKQANVITAIASGGFEIFAKHVQNQLGIDHIFANQVT
jgi:phosphoserine phosphatase